MPKCHGYGNTVCNVMTYCQRLFTPKGEKCLLIQAHENKLLHLSLMGKQELCWQCIFTHNSGNWKLLAIMHFMLLLLGSFYVMVFIREAGIKTGRLIPDKWRKNRSDVTSINSEPCLKGYKRILMFS